MDDDTDLSTYEPAIERLLGLYPILGHRDFDKDDLRQELRIAAWRALGTYKPGRGATRRSWIYGRMRYRLLDVLRGSIRAGTTERAVDLHLTDRRLGPVDLNDWHHHASPDSTEHTALVNVQLGEAVRAFKELQPCQQRALSASLDGRDAEGMCKNSQWTLATVARKRLRELMAA